MSSDSEIAPIPAIPLSLSARPDQEFLQWLIGAVERDGRSLRKIAAAAGIPPNTLRRALTHPTGRPTERNVRLLAAFFNGDPDGLAALAGYANLQIPAPDPCDFSIIQDWLRTALQARNETEQHASLGAGLSKNTIRLILLEGLSPERPTLDRLAAYFLVSRFDLRAMRPKLAGKVAWGKANAARLGHERMCELAKLAAGGRANSALSPEQRQEIAKLGGAVSKRTKTAADWKAMQAKGRDARVASGSWYKSEATRGLAIQRIHASGGPKRGGAKTLERYGREHFKRASYIAVQRKRNGVWRRCLFCDDPVRLIYQNLANKVRGRKLYHLDCFRDWRRSLPMVEKSRTWGTLGRIWQHVKNSNDEKFKERFRDQMRAEVEYVRQPNREGRRPALLINDKLSIEIAKLHDDHGMTAVAICHLKRLRTKRDVLKVEQGGSQFWNLLRLGRLRRSGGTHRSG